MRVDVKRSAHHESPGSEAEFSRRELKHARLLLRRLRFLEQQVRENGGIAEGSGGAVFAEMEHDALEWVLGKNGVDFLATPEQAQDIRAQLQDRTAV